MQKYKEGNDGSDRSEHTSGKWEGGGGRGSVIFTGYINSITQLAEAQGNDKSDRGERTPGNGGGGGISGVLQVIIC